MVSDTKLVRTIQLNSYRPRFEFAAPFVMAVLMDDSSSPCNELKEAGFNLPGLSLDWEERNLRVRCSPPWEIPMPR